MPSILIAEDKDSLRVMLEEMLKAEGWGVLGVASGSEAVERLRSGAGWIWSSPTGACPAPTGSRCSMPPSPWIRRFRWWS